MSAAAFILLPSSPKYVQWVKMLPYSRRKGNMTHDDKGKAKVRQVLKAMAKWKYENHLGIPFTLATRLLNMLS